MALFFRMLADDAVAPARARFVDGRTLRYFDRHRNPLCSRLFLLATPALMARMRPEGGRDFFAMA
nr:hypothetical protein [uncultured Cohaesibacter sp.]